jgi:hypothetical protein
MTADGLAVSQCEGGKDSCPFEVFVAKIAMNTRIKKIDSVIYDDLQNLR